MVGGRGLWGDMAQGGEAVGRRAARESGQGRIPRRGQGGQGFRTGLRETSFFELARGVCLLGWGGWAALVQKLLEQPLLAGPGNSKGLEVRETGPHPGLPACPVLGGYAGDK